MGPRWWASAWIPSPAISPGRRRKSAYLSLPLASDFYPHGEVASKYGILREGEPVPGISERAIYVVDKRGKVAYAKVYPSTARLTRKTCSKCCVSCKA